MEKWNIRILVVLVAVVILTSCSTAQNADDSLYHDLGGAEGIAQLTEHLLWAISEDDRVVHRFLESDLSRFTEKFAEHTCAISGGPCEYSGASMLRAHRGQAIESAEFNAVVENLYTAMEAMELPIGTQNRLLKLLAPMRSQIVGR